MADSTAGTCFISKLPRTDIKLQKKEDQTQMADSTAGTCFISKLPESIIVEIFLKLAVATLMRCRRVCKSWRMIISSPFFNQSRLAKAPSELVIFRSRKLFYFLEGSKPIPAAVSSHEKGSRYASRRSILHLVNSCNGLVCMTRCSGRENSQTCSLSMRYCHGKTIFVVNPVTSQCIALPPSPKDARMEFCGLGFCPVTNQFKVFRFLSKRSSWYNCFCNSDLSDYEVERPQTYVSDEELSEKLSGFAVHPDDKVDSGGESDGNSGSAEWQENSYEEDNPDWDDPEEYLDSDDDGDGDEEDVCLSLSMVEVYTLGTGTWRRIEVNSGSLEDALDNDGYHSSTYANGSLYWITERYGRFQVSSFNFETEQLQRVTNGEFYSDHVFGLGTYKSCLYLCRYEENNSLDYGSGIDGDDENYEVEDDLDVELFLLKSSWSRESVVKFPKDFHINEWENRVIKWFENGDILFFRSPHLCLFDREKQVFKTFSECKIRSEDDAIVHVPSFLSLEDVIKGEPSKVLNVGSKK